MEQKRYDAFISYRHHPADMAIAGEIQRLLEAYRPPRSVKNLKKNRIRRIFRDTTELPDSGDLGESLNQALASSEYLIVILSPEMLESKWCMQEIRTFKENHGNRCDHILPVLVRGEPEDIIPDLLRTETRTVTGADGVEREVEVAIEPLCCDVKADTLAQSKKKARTEFLRLAAPILGCGYDDLYRRNLRRARRRALVAALSAFALISAVLAVVSVFAYKTYIAEQNVRSNLVDVYVRNGADRIAEDEQALGMMYYSKALSLDPKAQAAKTGALLLLQQYDWLCRERVDPGALVNGRIRDGSPVAVDSEGHELHQSAQGYTFSDDPEAIISTGVLLTSADDGSCFTFLEDGTVAFWFPARRTRIAIPVPTAAGADRALIGLMTRMPKAMAVNAGQAAIALGETLYVYDLDAESEAYSEIARFDLGEIFTPGQERSILSGFVDAWFDVSGGLAVVTNNSATAVFDISQPGLALLNHVHQATGQVLQAAAFSADGDHYALAYGNDEGVYGLTGGCLRVYDRHGNVCMETDYEGGVALKGAAFEIGGPRVAAWGSGELMIWNWQDGSVVVPGMRIGNVEALCWTPDGRLLIDDGRGSVSTYAIAGYQASGDAGEAPAEQQRASFRDMEAVIRDGCVFSHSGTSVAVTNDRGETTDARDISGPQAEGEGVPSVNRMFVDRAHGTAYLWSDGSSDLIAITVNDAGKITALRRLDTQNKKPMALYAAWNGVVVEMASSELFYYADGASVTGTVLKPGSAGEISAFTSGPRGLVSFVIRNKRLAAGYSNKMDYSLELWDLNMGLLIREFIHSSQDKPEGLAFTDDGCLVFTLNDRQERWLVDAGDPDEKLTDALNSISCYALGEGQAIQARTVEFRPEAIADWTPVLSRRERAEGAPEQTVERRMAQVLARDGAAEWLRSYDEWWCSDAAQAMDLTSLAKVLQDYVSTARDVGLVDQLRTGFEAALNQASPGGSRAFAEPGDLAYPITDALIETDLYTDLIIGYYDNMAARYEEAAESDLHSLLMGYTCRIRSRILQGLGTKAFDMSDNPIYAPFLDSIRPYLSDVDIQQALITGDPVRAAGIVAEAGKSPSDYRALFMDCTLYMRLGYLSEADYSAFVQHLPDFTGIRLKQVTAAQFADGLRLEDNVVAIDGIYFGCPRDLTRLSESHPVARLTVLRDGEAIVTEPMAWDQLYGSFDG